MKISGKNVLIAIFLLVMLGGMTALMFTEVIFAEAKGKEADGMSVNEELKQVGLEVNSSDELLGAALSEENLIACRLAERLIEQLSTAYIVSDDSYQITVARCARRMAREIVTGESTDDTEEGLQERGGGS